MLVEPHVDVREVISAVMGALGIRTTSVSSAAEARVVLANDKPDLIVSDVCMAEESGLELIASIRKEERDGRMPAVAISGRATAEDREAALGAGFDEFLAKPFAMDQLVTALKGALSTASSAKP